MVPGCFYFRSKYLKRKCPGSTEKLNLDLELSLLDEDIQPHQNVQKESSKQNHLPLPSLLFFAKYSNLFFPMHHPPFSKLLPKSLPSWLFISLNSTTILTQLKPFWEKDICTKANMQNGKLKSHFSCNLPY